MSGLDEIERKLADADFFKIDLADEAFRQNAVDRYAKEWSKRKPFYARRHGIPALVCTRSSDVHGVMLAPQSFVMKAPDEPGIFTRSAPKTSSRD